MSESGNHRVRSSTEQVWWPAAVMGRSAPIRIKYDDTPTIAHRAECPDLRQIRWWREYLLKQGIQDLLLAFDPHVYEDDDDLGEVTF